MSTRTPARLRAAAVILAALAAFTAPRLAAVAQNVSVKAIRRASPLPERCVAVAPARVEGEIDLPALVREADCKGSGDMLADYTYVMKFASRVKGKDQVKEETIVYEVYMPTLKGGTSARGVLLVTGRNGVPVSPEELERERLRAGKRLEKEEDEAARAAAPEPSPDAGRAAGLLPLGGYQRFSTSRGSFNFRRGGAVLDVHTFLRACELRFVRRERQAGREALVFSFTPRADARLADDEKYIGRLAGTIWIDAQDRIVTRLEGRPAGAAGADSAPPGGDPPAVFFELMRLPEGVWLPLAAGFDGADYPSLFDHVTYGASFTYGEYKRFKAEAQDVKLDAPKPR